MLLALHRALLCLRGVVSAVDEQVLADDVGRRGEVGDGRRHVLRPGRHTAKLSVNDMERLVQE